MKIYSLFCLTGIVLCLQSDISGQEIILPVTTTNPNTGIMSGGNISFHYIGNERQQHVFLEEFYKAPFQNNYYRFLYYDLQWNPVRQQEIKVDSIHTPKTIVKSISQDVRQVFQSPDEQLDKGYENVRNLGLKYKMGNSFLITELWNRGSKSQEVWAFQFDSNYKHIGSILLLEEPNTSSVINDDYQFNLCFSPDSSRFCLYRVHYENKEDRMDGTKPVNMQFICFSEMLEKEWETMASLPKGNKPHNRLNEIKLSNSGILTLIYQKDFDINTASKQKDGNQNVLILDSRGAVEIDLKGKTPFYTTGFHPLYDPTGDLKYLLAFGSSKEPDFLEELLIIDIDTKPKSKKHRQIQVIPEEMLKSNKLYHETWHGSFVLRQSHVTSDRTLLLFDRYGKGSGKVYYSLALELDNEMRFKYIKKYDRFIGGIKNIGFNPAKLYSYINEDTHVPVLLFLDSEKNIKRKTRTKPKKGDDVGLAGVRAVPKDLWLIKASLDDELNWRYTPVFPLTKNDLYKGRISCYNAEQAIINGNAYSVIPFTSMKKGEFKILLLQQ